jgi:hypothetical protein
MQDVNQLSMDIYGKDYTELTEEERRQVISLSYDLDKSYVKRLRKI